MKKTNPIADYNQKAIYEFVNRNGFKNVAECVAHFGMYEFKKRKEQFFKDYQKEISSKPKASKDKFQKPITQNKPEKMMKKKSGRCVLNTDSNSNTQTEFHLRLVTVHKLIISDLTYDPTLKLNHLAEHYGINKKYLYALVHLNVIENKGTKYFPEWKILDDNINWDQMANRTKVYVNQKNYESRHKNLKLN